MKIIIITLTISTIVAVSMALSNNTNPISLKQILPKLPEVYEDSDKGNYFLKLNINFLMQIYV